MVKPFSEFRDEYLAKLNAKSDAKGSDRLIEVMAQMNLRMLEQYHSQFILPLLDLPRESDQQDES